MVIKSKKMSNPKFQFIETQGQVLAISIAENNAKRITTYIVESEWLMLKVDDVTVTFRLNDQRNAIQNITLDFQSNVCTFDGIENLSDCLQFLKSIQLKQYWKDQNIQVLLYTLFRFIVCIISSDKLEIANKSKTESEEALQKAIMIQKQLVNLLLFTFESFNIESSGYVVTKRAEYLLRVGLDPKEQYDDKTVLLNCRQILKLLHPDTNLGSTEYFKFIVEVQKYFK